MSANENLPPGTLPADIEPAEPVDEKIERELDAGDTRRDLDLC